jgi:hypothetical protein
MPPKKKKRKLDENATDVQEPPAKRARKNKRKEEKEAEEEENLEVVDLSEEGESKTEEMQFQEALQQSLLESKFNPVALAPKKEFRDPDLVASLDKDLVCCICLHLMENPHSFPCGHSFCKGMLTLLFALCFPCVCLCYTVCDLFFQNVKRIFKILFVLLIGKPFLDLDPLSLPTLFCL